MSLPSKPVHIGQARDAAALILRFYQAQAHAYHSSPAETNDALMAIDDLIRHLADLQTRPITKAAQDIIQHDPAP